MSERYSHTVELVQRKETTRKVELSPKFLAEGKSTFQRAISTAVSRHDIPDLLVLNIRRSPLSYLSYPQKSTLSVSKHVPVKEVNDKRQKTATFEVSSTGSFLRIQLIFTAKTLQCLLTYDSPASFSVSSP